MTPAQRNLLDAAKHLLDVLADPIVAYELTSDNATNRLDDAIKAAEADDSDGWTLCGPDGPFPDSGVEVEVTYLFGETIGGNEIYLPGRAMRSVYGTWVNFQSQEMPEIIAWAYPRKPYEPKGQA